MKTCRSKFRRCSPAARREAKRAALGSLSVLRAAATNRRDRRPFRRRHDRTVDDPLSTCVHLIAGSTPSTVDSAASASVQAAGRDRSSAGSCRACRWRSRTTSRNVWSARGRHRYRERAAERLAGASAPRSSTLSVSAFEHLRSARYRRARQSARRRWPRTGTDAAAGCRRRGWSAPSGRPVFPARARTAAAPACASPRPAPLPRCSVIALSSAASSSVVHLRERVEHALRHVGGGSLGEGDAENLFRRTPSSNRLITRCTSTWVLPAPALAATQADTIESDTERCRCRTSSGIDARRCSFALVVRSAAGARPFLNAGEMIVVAIRVVHIGWTSERYGSSSFEKSSGQIGKFCERLVGESVRRDVLELQRVLARPAGSPPFSSDVAKPATVRRSGMPSKPPWRRIAASRVSCGASPAAPGSPNARHRSCNRKWSSRHLRRVRCGQRAPTR